MILKKIYLLIPVLYMLLATIAAYSYQIPICNSTLNDSCISIIEVPNITNASFAMIYYYNGSLFLTNDTVLNNTSINYYNYTNLTTITQETTNATYITYIINNTNGSSYIFQSNLTLNKSYVNELFNNMFNNSSKYYNKTETDNLYALKSELSNTINSLGIYATKSELLNYDIRLTSLNNLNSINWTDFNLTKINEHIDDGGDFSVTWKTIVIIEGIVIILLLLFVVKTMMSE